MNMTLSSMLSSEALHALTTFADRMMDPGVETNTHNLIKTVEKNMDFGVAQKFVLQQKLSSDVATLVQHGAGGVMSEVSLAKARKALNKMYEKAWTQLDKALGNCKGFQERFEENDGAVTRDVNRLVERINDLVRIESESTLGIENVRKDMGTLRETEVSETRAYNLQLADDKADLTIYKNDLQVFAYIVDFTGTQCAAGPASVLTQICSVRKGANKGQKFLNFKEKQVQEGYEKILTPSAKKKIQEILQEVDTPDEVSSDKKGESFLQRSTPPTPPPPPPPAPAVVTTSPPPLMNKQKTLGDGPQKVTEFVVGGSDCGEGCIGGPGEEGDCGDILTMCPIHDKLSLLWGKHKDLVDGLTMEMMRRLWEFHEMKENIASQLRILGASESKLIALLSETKSNLAADRGEIRTKYTLKRRLANQYKRKTRKMKKSICWIACQDMAAVKIVRNAVLETSTVCPADNITDCVVEDWVPESCSKTCDESCVVNQPFRCGGWKQMSRDVMVSPDAACGVRCPKLTQQRRCGQVKCPMDCTMSSWSGYAECSAECGGGVKKQTRAVLSDTRNGGRQCAIAEDIENCNDQSCSVDCRLQDWTSWGGCSVACGSGVSIRRKHVLIPIKGDGKCPKGDALGVRLDERDCNTHKCAGDEICIAKQDLIVAIDSSSSIAFYQDGNGIGFNVMKKFTQKLLMKYEKKYYGNSKMQIGLINFGNGVIVKGTGAGPKGVSPAIMVQKLTGNLDLVRNAVCAAGDLAQCSEALSLVKYKKGFTNLAQAFVLAERMFTLKPTRNNAAHALMVITDGIASFKYQTDEMAQQLQDKAIMRYFIAVTKNGIESNVMEDVKRWASAPWDTNVMHVKGGLRELQSDPDYWAAEAIVKFCPNAYSVSVGDWERTTYGWQEVIDNGYCGSINTSRVIGWQVYNVEDCAGRAMEYGFQTFLMGNYHKRGQCIGGSLDGDLSQGWQGWRDTVVDPQCPPDNANPLLASMAAYDPNTLVRPSWHMYWNFYAIIPVSIQEQGY